MYKEFSIDRLVQRQDNVYTLYKSTISTTIFSKTRILILKDQFCVYAFSICVSMCINVFEHNFMFTLRNNCLVYTDGVWYRTKW